jgi:hypothetical protein
MYINNHQRGNLHPSQANTEEAMSSSKQQTQTTPEGKNPLLPAAQKTSVLLT